MTKTWKDFLLPTEGSSDPVVIGYPTKANTNTMTYPTKEQVEKAELEDLVRWNRFLPSPEGDAQAQIIKDIIKRIEDLGGITPEVSKSVGWGSNESEKKLNHVKLFEDFVSEGKVNEISKARTAAVKKIKGLYPLLGDKEAQQLAIEIDLHFSPDWKRDSDAKLKGYAKATAEQTDIKLGESEVFENFTFKKNKPTGRYASFEDESHEIKLNGKEVGTINELGGKVYQKTPPEDIGKFVIGLMVKKDPTKESPAPFKWIRFKARFDSAEAARKFLTDNFDEITKKYQLHQLEK